MKGQHYITKLLTEQHSMPATELLGFKSEETKPMIHVWIFKLFHFGIDKMSLNSKLECGPIPNVMAALPNIGGALCSTPQSLPCSNVANIP